MVHAALILTALTSVPIPRYVLGFWVLLAIGAGLQAWGCAGQPACQQG